MGGLAKQRATLFVLVSLPVLRHVMWNMLDRQEKCISGIYVKFNFSTRKVVILLSSRPPQLLSVRLPIAP